MKLADAQRVATRKNNKARKNLLAERAAFPLLADQLPEVDSLQVITPADVIEKHAAAREAFDKWKARFKTNSAQRLRETMARIEAAVSSTEWAEIVARVERSTLDLGNAWSVEAMFLSNRQEPLSDTELLVLAWLAQEERNVTVGELHRRRGDGLSRKEIFAALQGLERRRLVGGGRLRTCAVDAADRAPWEISIAGREWVQE